MPTLRRILKCTPAAVLGLLMVVWAISLYTGFYLVLPMQVAGKHFGVQVTPGTLWVGHARYSRNPPYFEVVPHPRYYNPTRIRNWFGLFDHEGPIPIPFVVTALLPLAIGPFLSFRFRLWHYLAYTALVAVELAYYLRWQE